MNEIEQRLEQLAARARCACMPPNDEAPFGLAARVIASARTASDAAALWTRLSLAALPLAMVATAACLWWSASSMTADAHDLAQVFIQSPLFP